MLHEFTLVLSANSLSDEQCDTLYESGCSDGTISTSQGISRIDFGREADSLESAIRSAIGNVNAAGITVVRVEIEADQLVTQTV